MADGNNNMPDQTQAMLALQQYAAQNAGGGKPGYFMGILPMDVKLSIFPAEGWGEKKIMQKKGGKPGLAEKIFNSIIEDCKKMNENAGVVYSGPVTNGEPPINGLDSGGGGSFVAQVSSPRGGDFEVG